MPLLLSALPVFIVGLAEDLGLILVLWDSAALDQAFERFQPDAVIHFAGLKAVGESVTEPARYYDVNVGGTAVSRRTPVAIRMQFAA